MSKERLICPKCSKRVCDVSVTCITGVAFHVELKCPNCRNIVDVEYPRSYHTEQFNKTGLLSSNGF